MSAGPEAARDPGAEALDVHEAGEARGTTGEKEPRAPMRDLVPYLRPHWRVLLLVSVVSVFGAAVTLAQPALVAAVIGAVERSEPLRPFVLLLLALVLGGAVVSAVQQFLLQRTAEDVVRGRAATSCTGCCVCRSASTTPAAPATWSPASAPTPPCSARS